MPVIDVAVREGVIPNQLGERNFAWVMLRQCTSEGVLQEIQNRFDSEELIAKNCRIHAWRDREPIQFPGKLVNGDKLIIEPPHAFHRCVTSPPRQLQTKPKRLLSPDFIMKSPTREEISTNNSIWKQPVVEKTTTPETNNRKRPTSGCMIEYWQYATQPSDVLNILTVKLRNAAIEKLNVISDQLKYEQQLIQEQTVPLMWGSPQSVRSDYEISIEIPAQSPLAVTPAASFVDSENRTPVSPISASPRQHEETSTGSSPSRDDQKLLEQLFIRTWDESSKPVSVTKRDLQRKEKAQKLTAQLRSTPVSQKTGYVSYSTPKQVRTRAGESEIAGTPLLQACNDLQDAIHHRDEHGSVDAYKRLILSLREPKEKRSPKTAKKLTTHEMEAFTRRNILRDESSCWIAILKSISRSHSEIYKTPKQKRWDKTHLRKAWASLMNRTLREEEDASRHITQSIGHAVSSVITCMIQLSESEIVNRIAIWMLYEKLFNDLLVPEYERIQQESSRKQLQYEDEDDLLRMIENKKLELGILYDEEDAKTDYEVERETWLERLDEYKRNREELRYQNLLEYPPSRMGVVRQASKFRYTGGDYTRARAYHHSVREPPTSRPIAFDKFKTSPGIGFVGSHASQPTTTPTQYVSTGSSLKWAFDTHRRKLEDSLFRNV